MNSNNQVPHEYQPISMWGYFGYSILFAIPILGLILAIVWSFGAANVNLKNFARSRFCILIIAIIIFLILFLTGMIDGVTGLIGGLG